MVPQSDREPEHTLCYVSFNVYSLNTYEFKLLLSVYILPLQ